MTIQPSRTASVFRVAYRRANRDPRKGYTYKIFKSELPMRHFVERLLAPPEDLPEKFGNLAPIAECHLHFATAIWAPLDPTTGNDIVNHDGLVYDGTEWVSIELGHQRLELLSARRASLNGAQLGELEALIAAFIGDEDADDEGVE
jgi:hypothetical protein